ncbi:hypothetical protein ACSDQ9_03900 [Aestuariimicrobium soli]|uniref:hypothetical protein n=1 Tax=Aestuariimicrobium soli TaxID=2035834 RepID=UPI003EBB9054
MTAPSSDPTPARPGGPSRVRWVVLVGCVALLAAGLVVGTNLMVGRGEAPLAQPPLTAPPPLTGTPTPIKEPEYDTSATPVSFPAKQADQQPRPSELVGGWTVLPEEPELFSEKAPVVYSDGSLGTLMVQWAPAPAGKALFASEMKWTLNYGTVICGRALISDTLTCAFPTSDGGAITVEGRGVPIEPLAAAVQDLQKQLP